MSAYRPAINHFYMPNIWQTVLDGWTIRPTIKQNERFRGSMHPEIFKLYRIQNDRQSAIIYLD